MTTEYIEPDQSKILMDFKISICKSIDEYEDKWLEGMDKEEAEEEKHDAAFIFHQTIIECGILFLLNDGFSKYSIMKNIENTIDFISETPELMEEDE